jgi:hypothetical protein
MIKIYLNSKYFNIIAHALGYIFDRYNKISEDSIYWVITDNPNFDKSSLYILFNPWKMDKMPTRYIYYNFEQLNIVMNVEDDFTKSEKFLQQLQNAEQVWDYSKINIAVHNSNNINAVFFPMGYTPLMKNVRSTIPFVERINTILFTGVMNERRVDILKPIHTLCKQHDYGMFLSNNCWDDEYNFICSKSKIGFNIHYYEGETILEVHRIIPLILDGIFVISERSKDSFYDSIFEDIVFFIDDANDSINIVETILSWNSDKVTEQLTSNIHKLIVNCNYYNFFNEYIDVKKLKN